MKIAGNRWVTLVLNIFMVLSLLVILHIILIGGIDLNLGNVIPGTEKVKFTANKLSNPFLALLVLVLLKLLLSRPRPVSRFVSWLRRNRCPILLGLLIVLLAGLPRLWDLGGHSLNSDELLWIDRGQRTDYHLREHEFKKATLHLGHPGVVPAALIGASSIYLGEGSSTLSFNLMDRIVAARLPIAVVGIATCLLLYLVARISYGEAASFWAAVFLALFPAHLSLSRVAHIDSTLTLFFTLSLLCYLTYAQRMRLSWKISSAVFFGLALLTKAPAFLLPFIILSWKAAARLIDRRGKLRFWEASDLAWLGLGLAIYLSLFTKLWCKPEELHWTRYTHFLPLTRKMIFLVDRLGALPWLQITGCVLLLCVCVAVVRRRRGGEGPAFWRAQPCALKGILLVLLTLSFFQLFRSPLVGELLLTSKVYHVEDLGHLKFWMGQIVTSPPRWFYPYMIMISAPPIFLFFLFCGVVRSCTLVVRRRTCGDSYLMALLAPAVFIVIMSLGNKMAFRYLAPVLPFLCLLSACGLEGLLNACAERRIVRRPEATRPVIYALATAVIIGAFILPLLSVAPEYELYHNFLIGGPSGASRRISVGWGVGTRQAVDYLKAHVKEEDSIYALGLSSVFRYYWDMAEPAPQCDVLINRTKPPHTDWLVIPLGHRMKRREMAILRLADTLPREQVITACDIGFVDIYKLEDTPAASGELYEAEDLQSDLGEQVSDEAAGNGRAIRGIPDGRRGMLLYGPYRRYGKGCWRAVFRMKVDRSESDAPAALISVSGLATADRVESMELRPAGFERAGSYRDFFVDFYLEKPRRIQFCVESYGNESVWVDRVTVQRLGESPERV